MFVNRLRLVNFVVTVYFTILTLAVVLLLADNWYPAGAADPARDKPVRLVSEEEHVRRLALIPSSADSVLDNLRKDPRLVFYDRKTTPPIYQHWRVAINETGPHIGLMSIFYNESGNPTEPYGNANREFPWAATAGLTPSDPVLHFVIMDKPAKVSWKVLRRQNFGQRDEVYMDWIYQDGTTFGEIILVTDPATKKQYASEVRLRRKNNGAWTSVAYRPIPTVADLEAAVGDVSVADRAVLKATIVNPPTAKWRLRNRHPRRIIDVEYTIESLPEISADGVRKLLARPFKNALGAQWRKADPPTYAPTTYADFHIVPKNYDAGAIEVSSKSCARCHDTAGMHVEDIEMARDWYGQVRSADTIFSFHPFRPELADGLAHTRRDNLLNPQLYGKLFVAEK